MKRLRSLTSRLYVGLLFSIIGLLIVVAITVGTTLRYEMDEVLDQSHVQIASHILPTARTGQFTKLNDAVMSFENLGKIVQDSEEHDDDHDEYTVLPFRVTNLQGDVLFQPGHAFPSTLPFASATGFVDHGQYRVFNLISRDDNVVVQVAEHLAHRREALAEGLQFLAIPFLVFVPLSLVGVWFITRLTLEPVRFLERELKNRGRNDLSSLSRDGVPSELIPMVDEVNELLDRLRLALNAERSFAQNSAHELRTPIAAALAQLQRLEYEFSEGDQIDRLKQVEARLIHLGNISEKLLQLSRSESGMARVEDSVDLLPVLELMTEEFNRSSRNGLPIELCLRDEDTLLGTIDVDAFGIVLRNIVENAEKYSDGTEPVRIWIEDNRNLHIANSCSILPEPVLRTLTDRFVRNASSEIDGSGLGLAIVSSIMDQTGGSLSILSPASDRENGFEVVLTFDRNRSN